MKAQHPPLNTRLLDAQGQLTTNVVSGGIWPKFELTQAFMHVLVIFKYQKDRIKTTEKKWIHHFKSIEIFPDAQNVLRPSFELALSLLPARTEHK